MGLLTWIIIGLVILAIIGMGVGTFFSGVWSGIQKVGSNPIVQEATDEGKKVLENGTRQIIENATSQGS